MTSQFKDVLIFLQQNYKYLLGLSELFSNKTYHLMKHVTLLH